MHIPRDNKMLIINPVVIIFNKIRIFLDVGSGYNSFSKGILKILQIFHLLSLCLLFKENPLSPPHCLARIKKKIIHRKDTGKTIGGVEMQQKKKNH